LRYTLDWLVEQTPNGMFHRTHRSAVVNITKITKATSKSVFIGEVEIPVSRGNQIRL
jgi:DNA-binding LytR/AlgR family response regulator